MGSDAETKCLLYGIARKPCFGGSDCMQVYGDGVPDQAKCPHFRGVRKAGFHCIMGKLPSATTYFMYKSTQFCSSQCSGMLVLCYCKSTFLYV